jgi:hypothetical protein
LIGVDETDAYVVRSFGDEPDIDTTLGAPLIASAGPGGDELELFQAQIAKCALAVRRYWVTNASEISP